MIGRLWGFFRRPVRPQKEPMLVNVCAFAMATGRRGHEGSCDTCGRSVGFVRLVYHWTQPIESGGLRDPFNVSARCGACWESTGRTDGLGAPEGEDIHRRKAPRVTSPVHVIEL